MKSEFINTKTHENLSNWLSEYCCEIEVESLADIATLSPIDKIQITSPKVQFKDSHLDLEKYNNLRFITSKNDLLNFEYPTLSKEESIIILPSKSITR
jgi:hypothetical protein